MGTHTMLRHSTSYLSALVFALLFLLARSTLDAELIDVLDEDLGASEGDNHYPGGRNVIDADSQLETRASTRSGISNELNWGSFRRRRTGRERGFRRRRKSITPAPSDDDDIKETKAPISGFHAAWDKARSAKALYYCLHNADARVAGQYREDTQDAGKVSDDFLRNGVARYLKCGSDSITLHRSSASALANAEWRITYGNTRFYQVTSNNDLPPTGPGKWRYNYRSSVSRDYKYPVLMAGQCKGYVGCESTALTKISTASPTTAPTVLPSRLPSTALPTARQTFAPTVLPSRLPSTASPTTLRTTAPTSAPTFGPSKVPSELPTNMPSSMPTEVPSMLPTAIPTEVPTHPPSSSPSEMPTHMPTTTDAPTFVPSVRPTDSPTVLPTFTPTHTPSVLPTPSPSLTLTLTPTSLSTASTAKPTSAPTGSPVVLATQAPVCTTLSFRLHVTPRCSAEFARLSDGSSGSCSLQCKQVLKQYQTSCEYASSKPIQSIVQRIIQTCRTN